MCGRYTLYDTSIAEFKISENMVGKNYNIAPASIVPVVIAHDIVKLVRWTFKVPWANNLNIINARSETLETKRIFQESQRCVFIANGYFEWLRRGEIKIPYYHTFKDRMMYFGGIFNDTGACIVTRKSYQMKKKIHQRQPVILRYNDFSAWLASTHDYSCDHSCDMSIYQVSPAVNISKNDSPSNIVKIQ